MPKFVALKDLPKGTKPGEEFEATDAEGRALILVGAAKPLDPDPPTTRRPRYARRDLAAADE